MTMDVIRSDRPQWVAFNRRLAVRTSPRKLHDLSEMIHGVVAESFVREGLCTVYVPHTSASLVIQENADPDVLGDLGRFMATLVPESGRYAHSSEGPDDMPAHIRAALTQTSLGIPVLEGRLALGVWQAVYLWEHRAAAYERTVIVNLIGTG